MKFHATDGAVYAANVNLSQAAKKAKALHLVKSVQEGEDLIAKLLGHRDFFEVRQLAKKADTSRNIAHLDELAIYPLLHKKSVTKGESFPRDLPRQFNMAWKTQAHELLDAALAMCKPDELDFVALVGGPGSGKTILAKAHCLKTGGHLIDADMYAWWATLSQGLNVAPATYLDRPAKTPTTTGTTARSQAVSEWWATSMDQRTEAKAAQVFRVSEIGFPMDEVEITVSTSPARTLVRSRPTVIAFASIDAVQEALDTAWHVVTMGNPQNAKQRNWGTAHVISVADLQTCTLRRQPK